MAGERLDALLHRRGLFGDVRLGPRRVIARKPGQSVDPEVEVEVAERPEFVSRGGRKLANALDLLDLPVARRRCMDVGASTGGFTDCLLQRGAGHVIAVDVAYGELAWSLRQDERVTVLERVNARQLNPAVLPYEPELIVCDLSFISLVKVLPAVLSCAADRHDVLAMVKPQFEVGRERVGSGGVVRDPALRREAIAGVAAAVRAATGAEILGAASSGLPGPKGNRETFVWLAEAGRAGGITEDGFAELLTRIEPDEARADG
jgi:23S rRNA (cytidine1920-2'-O)/16S rRNA (cytidine1409-2'-O)-methyltransferase